MALSVTSATKVGQNLTIHFSIDGNAQTGEITIPEIQALFSDISDILPQGNYKHLALLLLARYYLDKGTYTLAQIVAKCSIPD